MSSVRMTVCLETKMKNMVYCTASSGRCNKIHREIYRIADKIIDTISKNPTKQKKANNFFQYYLPVTLKILQKYDEIENQRLESAEGKEFMKNTKNMIRTIKKSFNEQLSNLYQADMIDTDADMKVFKTMLKTDGYSEIEDFNIENKDN